VKLDKLDHIGIAVEKIDEALPVWEGLLGLRFTERGGEGTEGAESLCLSANRKLNPVSTDPEAR